VRSTFWAEVPGAVRRSILDDVPGADKKRFELCLSRRDGGRNPVAHGSSPCGCADNGYDVVQHNVIRRRSCKCRT
ncbi:hypothetical protein M3665_25590, partial [Bacillus licheniformis]|nr:hypothetical protein [Bacillus licheniformis]